MARLKQLVTANYRACDWDLRLDREGRAYWDRLFRWHLEEVLLPLIRAEYASTPAARLDEFRHEYVAALDGVLRAPEAQPRLDILYYTELREGLLARFDFPDPFATVKRTENEAALELLPGLLREIDAAPADRQMELLAEGLMAGNIFDLGARATVERHRDGRAAFAHTRATQPRRPWLYDDLDPFAARWDRAAPRSPYRHVMFLVDNAGSDVVLGCLPFARGLLARGARVTLAANSRPALNDVTAGELERLVERVSASEPDFRAHVENGTLAVAATGTGAPLIDLGRLSAEFVERSGDADLLILHGMGRAIESNFHAQFACDVIHSAVVKDEAVAARIGGQLFDCVFRWSPAAG